MSIISMRGGDADLIGLEDFCRALVGSTDRVVEIGCYAGESSTIFARYAARLYCIDRWEDGVIETGLPDGTGFHYQQMAQVQALFDEAIAGWNNVVKIRGHSNDLADVFAEGQFDVVYIDALHAYSAVCNDIFRWWPKVRNGGYLGGHNYSPRWPGVVQAVCEAFGRPDRVFGDSSWAVRKAPARKKRDEACVRWSPPE
jgi:hypothetical protein